VLKNRPPELTESHKEKDNKVDLEKNTGPAFAPLLQSLQNCGLTFVKLIGPVVGPAIKATVITDVPKAVKDAEVAGLEMFSKGEDVSYRRVVWVPAVALQRLGADGQPSGVPECWAIPAVEARGEWTVKESDTTHEILADLKAKCADSYFALQLRSAEGVLYFLGGLARHQLRGAGQSSDSYGDEICWDWSPSQESGAAEGESGKMAQGDVPAG
jgi:hypothetical protein